MEKKAVSKKEEKVVSTNIKKVGNIDTLTLSKKSVPGDGTHGCGVKGIRI